MPSAAPPNPRAASKEPDELDRFFGFDEAVEDFMKDLPIERENARNTAAPAEPVKDIDAQINVKKKRQPVPKLDDNRLLSENGITKLRKVTKSRLRFKGKGHEFSDISRLLTTYQLWLDDLYPRAKFRDALGMVEKVGHSKRMQVMRRTWLDDTKPYRKDPSPEGPEEAQMSGALPATRDDSGPRNVFSDDDDDDAPIFGGEKQQPAEDTNKPEIQTNDAPDDDELDALLAEQDTSRAGEKAKGKPRRNGLFEEDSDEDELDALLAAEPSNNLAAMHALTAGPRDEALSKNDAVEDDFADEEEAMAGMDVW